MIRCRVVCALNVAMEIRSPTNKFIKVDFPTFGLPTIFTNPALCISIIVVFRQKNASGFRCVFYNLRFILFQITIITPFYINGTVSETCTECCKNQVITFSQLLFVIPETQRKCACAGITITLNIYHYLFHRNFQSGSNCIDNTHVSLMRNHPVDVFLCQTILFRNLCSDFRHV